MEFKFALTDFAGTPVSYVLAKEIDVPKPEIEKQVGHHIVIVDRSGSMNSAMAETRTMVEKVFTVEEFHDANLLLTLISYSSAGDYTVHFSRTPVSEVNKSGSAHIESLRSIRATCLTSVSQALKAATGFIESETTVVSLHTDGWFNDASPASEKKAIDKWVAETAKRPNVMVNCIAYQTWSDFNYLATVANRMSGSCILARDLKQVYTALHDTTALLAGRTLPAIPLNIDGADWQVALNYSKRKVNGASTDFILRGTSPEDAMRVLRFSAVSESTFKKSKAADASESDDGLSIMAAYARTRLAEGKINDAKFVASAMRCPSFFLRHYNALSSDRLAAFAEELESLATRGNTVAEPNRSGAVAGLGAAASRSPLTRLFAILNHNTDQFAVHLPKFTETYKRRGIKRLNGKFDDSGVFVPNAVDLVEAVELTEDPLVQVSSFAVNTAEATINMNTYRDAELVKDGKRVNRVAGKKLDLSVNRSYTIIADGAVCAPTLTLSLTSKPLFNTLQAAGFLPGEAAFDAKGLYEIPLGDFPVVPLDASSLTMPDVNTLVSYAQSLVGLKILNAVLPDTAKGAFEWTPEQVVELREHGLTPGLSFSAPSTNHYTDRDKAASEGHIDSYTRYIVSYGTAAATDLRTSLWSANEYLARRFEVDDIKKPKWADVPTAKHIGIKTLSARTKLTELDTLVMPVFESYIERKVWAWDADTIKKAIHAVEAQVDMVERRLSEIALVLGSTGLVPEHWSCEILDGEKLAERHPEIDMPKAHAEGTFFGANGAYIGLHPVAAWYTTAAGEAAADALVTSA